MLNLLWCLADRRHQRSNETRELSLLAYLSQMQSADLGPVRPLHSLVPYQVDDLNQANEVVNLLTAYVGQTVILTRDFKNTCH